MKIKIYLLTLALFLLASPLLIQAGGIPEPGVILYGSVTNAGAGNVRMTVGTLSWSVAQQGSASAVTVSTPLSNINGLFSYRVRIPYETIVGSSTLGPNTLSIPAASATNGYTAVLTTGNQTYPASILAPATGAYNFDPRTHGMVLQVNLQVIAPGAGVGLSLPSGTLPSPSPSGGASGAQLQFTRMAAHPEGGVWLEWSGTAVNKNYMLLRAEQMTGDTNDFKLVATFAPLGASGTNQFLDTSAMTNNTYFYQLQVK